MIELAAKILVAYLLGSVLGSMVVGRLRGVDIRSMGSGNPGGTNALRTQGKAFAAAVMLIDVGKGWLASAMLAPLPLPAIPRAVPPFSAWLPVACATAVIVGHVYPAFYGLRGGKGVATFIGAVLGLQPWLVVPLLLAWLLIVVLTGFVSLASIAAAVTLPLLLWGSDAQPRVPLLAFGAFVAAFVALAHRANFARIREGTEPRARRLWLFGRRGSR